MNSRPGSDCLNIGQYVQKGSDCSLPSSSFTIYLPSKANCRTNSRPQPQINGGTAVWIFSHHLSHLSFMRFLHLYSLTSSIRSTMQQARSPRKHKTIIIIKAAIIFCPFLSIYHSISFLLLQQSKIVDIERIKQFCHLFSIHIILPSFRFLPSNRQANFVSTKN